MVGECAIRDKNGRRAGSAGSAARCRSAGTALADAIFLGVNPPNSKDEGSSRDFSRQFQLKCRDSSSSHKFSRQFQLNLRHDTPCLEFSWLPAWLHRNSRGSRGTEGRSGEHAVGETARRCQATTARTRALLSTTARTRALLSTTARTRALVSMQGVHVSYRHGRRRSAHPKTRDQHPDGPTVGADTGLRRVRHQHGTKDFARHRRADQVDGFSCLWAYNRNEVGPIVPPTRGGRRSHAIRRTYNPCIALISGVFRRVGMRADRHLGAPGPTPPRPA